jgi:hypothetical protein
MEREDALLRESGLEDDEPPAKKECIDSENITRKRKHSTGKHPFSIIFSQVCNSQ